MYTKSFVKEGKEREGKVNQFEEKKGNFSFLCRSEQKAKERTKEKTMRVNNIS